MSKRKDEIQFPTQVSELTANPRNPREITPEAAKGLGFSMDSFGDLSVLNFCVKSGHLVCGHQRVSQLPPDAAIQNVREETDPTGQVARGEIVVDGVTWAIRFVDWDESKEMAACVAANSNRIQGQFSASIFPILDELQLSVPDLADGLLFDDLRIELNDAMDTGATGKGDFGDDPGPTEPPVVPVSKPGEIYELGLHTTCPKCGKMNPVKAGQ